MIALLSEMLTKDSTDTSSDIDKMRAELLGKIIDSFSPEYPDTKEQKPKFLSFLKRSTQLNQNQVHVLSYGMVSDDLRIWAGLEPKYHRLIEEILTMFISLGRKGIAEKLSALQMTDNRIEESEVGRLRKVMSGIRNMNQV